MRSGIVLILLSLLSAVLHAQSSGQPRPLVFTHVTIIDATGPPARPDMTIVITGDRITQIGRNLLLPKNAQVVDATGKYVIPGLWDMHVHLQLWQ